MDVLLDEVDSLEAILMDDVKITKNSETGFPEVIETTIFPTVGEDIDRQYICVTLQVMPKPGYPDISPNFQLIKPRGLDDNRLNEIKNACIQKLSDSLGYPVVFDLIDVIREHLTGSNLPSGQCVVCLYGFQEGDEFTKTECYHYLHSYCLARHLIASKKNYQEEQDKLPLWLKKMSNPFQATCPVCRERITDQSENLKNSKPPSELESAPEFHLTDELKELQAKMTNLYLRQKSRGAIIDPDAEECNVLLLGPDETATATTDSIFNTKTNEYNQSGNSVTIKENGTEQNASTMQTNAQSNRRSNSFQQHRNNQQQQQQQQQQQRHQSNNTVSQQPVTSGNNSSSSTIPTTTNSKCTNEDSTSNNHSYNRHYNRRHYHHHHRSRRHHNHHYNNNNNNNNDSSQQETNSQQQKTNIRASCGSGTR